MADPPGILGGISLSTIVQVGTLGAAIVASWATLGGRIGELERDVADLRKESQSSEALLSAVATRTSVLEIRYENLRDVVMELRRQSDANPR